MSHLWQQGPFLPEDPVSPEPRPLPQAPPPSHAVVAAPPPYTAPAPPLAPATDRFGTPVASQFGAPATDRFGTTVASQFGAPATSQFGTPTMTQYGTPVEPTYGGWPPGPVVDGPPPTRRKVGLVEAVKRGYRGTTDYGSRATPGEYWWFQVWLAFLYVVGFGLLLVAAPSTGTGKAASGGAAVAGSVGLLLSLVLMLAFLITAILPALALSVRRLHDAGFTGWWILLGWLPFGSLALLVMFCLPGVPRRNTYGPIPT